MDYSDDRCMNKFTDEQNNRMRCSLLHYRPNLYSIADIGGCSAADLAEPFGQLNFFNVSLFLNEFASNGANADINGDGEWNFFDVSEFLTIFAQGCP